MAYVVARWWTFGNPFGLLSELTAMLQTLSRCREESIRTIAFDGRRHVRTCLDNRKDLRRRAFPARFCDLELQAPSASRTARRPGDWAVTLSVSPVSALWQPVTKRAPKNRADHAAALSSRSIESYVRKNKLKKMPHLVQGWAVPPRTVSRERQLREALECLRGMHRQGSKRIAMTGGVDFVSHFAEMGTYDIEASLAAHPSGWEQLASRFDDMHKVMFGPPRMFNCVCASEARRAFTSVETIGVTPREFVIAVARTAGSARRFAKRPTQMTVA